MIRQLALLLSVLFLTTACASNVPDSSATSSVEGGVADESEARPDSTITGDDIIFDDDLSDTAMRERGLSGLDRPPENEVQGTQADLVSSVGDRVYYGYDSAELTAEARETLEQQAEWLRTYPDLSVTIEGHADERGTREYNLALGERRANAAKNYLVALGIVPGRLEVVSYGKERPAVLGSNPAAWARNRRAVLVVN